MCRVGALVLCQHQPQALSGKAADGYWVRPTGMFKRV